ncbi:MAG: zinc ribbon domain-containing protein, partial [Pseudomonadota bacterium]
MINCPKCHVPNSDESIACSTCGEPLAELSTFPELAITQESEPPVQSGFSPAMDPMDMGAPDAQNQIDEFMVQSRIRKRNKWMLNLGLLSIVLMAIVFYFVRSSQRKAELQQLGQFYSDFIKIDEESVAKFWRCVVRAQHRDIHKSDNLVVTDGLKKAFSSFPQSQPVRIKDTCLPEITSAIEEFGKLKAPEGFGTVMSELEQSLERVKSSFDSYVKKLEVSKDAAAQEKEILEASPAFHVEDKETFHLAVGYLNFLLCVYPDLPLVARDVKNPPNMQPFIDFVLESCKKDSAFADNLRVTCYPKLKETTKPKEWDAIVRKMSGDNRDNGAMELCFKWANKGFFDADLDAIGKTFV